MEVYGEKPKKFTKEWWEYFWDYYKWHTIVAVFVIIVIVSTIVENVNKVHYDMQMDFVSEHGLTDDAQSRIIELMQERTKDITGNEKKEAYLNFLNMADTSDPQMTQAMYTKLMVEAGYSESYVFIVSKQFADYFAGGGAFLDTEKWTDKESYNGEAVSLKDSEKLKNLGIDTDDLYVAVRNIREDEKDKETAKEKQKNEIEFAKYLLD